MSGNRNTLRASGGGSGGEQRDEDDPARDQGQDTGMDREGELPPSERTFDPRQDTRSGRDPTFSDGPVRSDPGQRNPPAARSDSPPAAVRDGGDGGDERSLFEKIEDAGQGVIDRADEVSGKLEDRPGGKEAAALVGATAPVAVAEPTPVGEAAVGATAAGILAGAAIAEKTNVDQQIRDRLKDFPQFTQEQSQSQDQSQPEGEVPLGPAVPESEIDITDPAPGNELAPSQSRQEITEVEPGRPQRSEIEISDPNEGSEVGPGIATAPVATGIGEARERQRQEVLTGEDIVGDEAVSEVDDKLEQIRDQLERRQNQFERDFVEGAGESGVRERTRNEQAQGELTRVEQPQGTQTATDTGTATPPLGAGVGPGFGEPALPGEGVGTGLGQDSGGRVSERPRIRLDAGDADDREDREEDILQKLSETGIGGAEDFERFEQEVLKTDDPLGEVLGDTETR